MNEEKPAESHQAVEDQSDLSSKTDKNPRDEESWKNVELIGINKDEKSQELDEKEAVDTNSETITNTEEDSVDNEANEIKESNLKEDVKEEHTREAEEEEEGYKSEDEAETDSESDGAESDSHQNRLRQQHSDGYSEDEEDNEKDYKRKSTLKPRNKNSVTTEENYSDTTAGETETNVDSNDEAETNVDSNDDGEWSENKNKEKEDDEEKDEENKSPTYVPRRTGFWDHDDRFADINVQESREPQGSKRLWDKAEVDRWHHDKYNEEEQGPKAEWELEQTRRELEERENRRSRGGDRGARNLGDFLPGDGNRQRQDGNNDRKYNNDRQSYTYKSQSGDYRQNNRYRNNDGRNQEEGDSGRGRRNYDDKRSGDFRENVKHQENNERYDNKDKDYNNDRNTDNNYRNNQRKDGEVYEGRYVGRNTRKYNDEDDFSIVTNKQKSNNQKSPSNQNREGRQDNRPNRKSNEHETHNQRQNNRSTHDNHKQDSEKVDQVKRKGRGRGRGKNEDKARRSDEHQRENLSREERIEQLPPRLREQAREKVIKEKLEKNKVVEREVEDQYKDVEEDELLSPEDGAPRDKPKRYSTQRQKTGASMLDVSEQAPAVTDDKTQYYQQLEYHLQQQQIYQQLAGGAPQTPANNIKMLEQNILQLQQALQQQYNLQPPQQQMLPNMVTSQPNMNMQMPNLVPSLLSNMGQQGVAGYGGSIYDPSIMTVNPRDNGLNMPNPQINPMNLNQIMTAAALQQQAAAAMYAPPLAQVSQQQVSQQQQQQQQQLLMNEFDSRRNRPAAIPIKPPPGL